MFSDHNNQIQNFVQYAFDRKEHSVELRPHGNAKGSKLYSRSKPSTLRLLKESASVNTPRRALQEVETLHGGVTEAKSECDIPRNRQQVYNINHNKKRKANEGVASAEVNFPKDVLAQVMLMCKQSSGTDWSVEAAPEPMCVLATDQQIADIVRFCTGDRNGILSVDPTFNLGPFYVNPTTYSNLLVTTKNGNHPILLGPVIIHQTKTLRPFHYFASTLLRLNPQLVHLEQMVNLNSSRLLVYAFLKLPT